jgi:hypothetical protein
MLALRLAQGMTDKKPDETAASSSPAPGKPGRGLGYVPEEPVCPVCLDLGFREELHEVRGLEMVSRNPQVEKGAPRVIDCTGGCRFSLEPYFNPMSDGRFCYMVIRSERNPESVVNHYWLKTEWIGPPVD